MLKIVNRHYPETLALVQSLTIIHYRYTLLHRSPTTFHQLLMHIATRLTIPRIIFVINVMNIFCLVMISKNIYVHNVILINFVNKLSKRQNTSKILNNNQQHKIFSGDIKYYLIQLHRSLIFHHNLRLKRVIILQSIPNNIRHHTKIKKLNFKKHTNYWSVDKLKNQLLHGHLLLF